MPSYRSHIGLIGIGYWGKHYLRHFPVAAVSDTTAPSLEHIPFYRDPMDLIHNPHIRAVVIASPAATHFSLGKESLLAKKHCLIEKPLALSYDHVLELNRLAVAQHCHLITGHQHLYHPAFHVLKQCYENGQLGTLQHITAIRRNLGIVRSHENVLWSLGPHDLSLLFGITDASFPLSISCSGRQLYDNGIEDECSLELSFREGFSASIYLSWAYPQKQRVFTLEGSLESIVFNDSAPWDEKMYLVKAKRYIPLQPEEPLKLMCQAFERQEQMEYLRTYDVLDKAQILLKRSASLECNPYVTPPHALSTTL